mmetsp:Transcript_980/g.2998  ORF Transcript_980/g.2998 Transcript_980/m.2998 type:complete len:209 (+) Transcript_980:1860-2486(+)
MSRCRGRHGSWCGRGEGGAVGLGAGGRRQAVEGGSVGCVALSGGGLHVGVADAQSHRVQVRRAGSWSARGGSGSWGHCTLFETRGGRHRSPEIMLLVVGSVLIIVVAVAHTPNATCLPPAVQNDHRHQQQEQHDDDAGDDATHDGPHAGAAAAAAATTAVGGVPAILLALAAGGGSSGGQHGASVAGAHEVHLVDIQPALLQQGSQSG